MNLSVGWSEEFLFSVFSFFGPDGLGDAATDESCSLDLDLSLAQALVDSKCFDATGGVFGSDGGGARASFDVFGWTGLIQSCPFSILEALSSAMTVAELLPKAP